MASYNIRFSSQLTFDEQQEADIIKCMEALNASHKAGQFISSLIRIAFDCPELFEEKLGTLEPGAVLRAMDDVGMSYNRKAFFNNVNKEVTDMREKIDKMYNMILNMYILAQMGKTLGLEDKAKNELMAQFIVEKQYKELQDLLGESLSGGTLASNKIQNIEKIANDALEYIINCYSGIVDELKQSNSIQYVQQLAPVVEEKAENNTNVAEEKVETTKANTEKSSSESPESEYVDFGDADFSALDNFFGQS